MVFRIHGYVTSFCVFFQVVGRDESVNPASRHTDDILQQECIW